MTLATGTKLGPYEIVAPLGAGGMGEVYRARDTRLNREVAVKISAEHFSDRFEREARSIAALNHPNICTLFDVGPNYLVMELVEGPTLADRIRQGPVPLDETLQIARQIAEALEAAHEKGIVHRDLKPGNVKIKPDGAVKVLDFGLAKMADLPEGSPESSPTLTFQQGTRAGMILGTAAYMAPEQARGKSVDRRADIWAFGCVLYELITEKRAFEGETVSDILAAVIMKEPDWSALPASMPPFLRRLLKRCLEKDPKRRLQAIGEARIAIENPEEDPPPGATAPSAKLGTRQGLFALGLILLGGLITGTIAWYFAPAPPPRQVRHLSITLPAGLAISEPYMPELALSPDGTNLVFSAKKGAALQLQNAEKSGYGSYQLYRRPLGEPDAQPIAGTEGGVGPMFSPDGAWIAFSSATVPGAAVPLRKIALAGGPVQTLCASNQSGPGAWSPEGTIFFSSSHENGLARVSAAGGNCQDLTAPDRSHAETIHLMPQVLPGGQALLFTVLKGFIADQASVAVLSLQTGKPQILIPGGANPHYVPGGYLVYARDGSLLSVPFDPSALKVIGSPVRVLENLMTNSESGAAQFTFAPDGTMAYVAGNGAESHRKVVLVGRDGKSQELTRDEGAYEDLDLSPDGHRIALTIQGPTWHIWIYDIPRGTLTRLTFENDNRDPHWSADGQRVAYTSIRNGKCALYWKPADGSGPEEQLVPDSTDCMTAESFSRDGKYLAYEITTTKTAHDIWILPLSGDRKPQPFATERFSEWSPTFSPDGHWLAYASDESGRAEIYVRPFPGPGGKLQISSEGSDRAIWSREGTELFYRNGGKLMAVPIDTKRGFVPGAPHMLWEGNYLASGHYFDVMPGAKQFVFIKEMEQTNGAIEIKVVLNWFDELKARMAAQK